MCCHGMLDVVADDCLEHASGAARQKITVLPLTFKNAVQKIIAAVADTGDSPRSSMAPPFAASSLDSRLSSPKRESVVCLLGSQKFTCVQSSWPGWPCICRLPCQARAELLEQSIRPSIMPSACACRCHCRVLTCGDQLWAASRSRYQAAGSQAWVEDEFQFIAKGDHGVADLQLESSSWGVELQGRQGASSSNK